MRLSDLMEMRENGKSISEIGDSLSVQDLRDLTNASIDEMLESIEGCVDADVTFVPDDPEANDPAAADDADVDLAWTLGHVIVHSTASGEEYGFTGTQLARGVEFMGRPRYEVPWETMQTIDQCRHRLEESRRMRLALLDVWPDEPHLDVTYSPSPNADPINAKAAFARGLMHDGAHQDQIREIVRQAKAARSSS
ncbi:MAG: DinB family protein [Thermomicrobiales bacterium]